MFYRGSLTTFSMPAADDLQKLTATTFAANGGFFVEKTIPTSMPAGLSMSSLIVKQNRAFDEILGDIGDAIERKSSGNRGSGPLQRDARTRRWGRYPFQREGRGHHAEYSRDSQAVRLQR